MPLKKRKISLLYFIIVTLLMVGLFPLVLTGWLLSDKSAKELRAVENRYQIQLVQEKARQIQMFGKRYGDLVSGIAMSLELAEDLSILSAVKTEQKLGSALKDDRELLAIYVKPLTSDSLTVFRPETITRADVVAISTEAEEKLASNPLMIGEPRRIQANGDFVQSFASPVVIGEQHVATVVAIVSLREMGKSIVGIGPTQEAELWNAGLPIIFVVNEQGIPVFHPDPAMVAGQKPFVDLKIVEEWRESGRQVQSALVPFNAEFDGRDHSMIGAYSTVSFGSGMSYGVITMQDERNALASVAEMRVQTWMISLAFAFVALVVGFVCAKLLTSPLQNLAAAAQQIASGDFSSRVESRNLTEIGTLAETFNVMSDRLEDHIAKLAAAAKENRELFVGTVKALAAAIDGKDKYTRGHSERVARISVAIGTRLHLPEDELEKLRMSALLHDVGKIAIDDAILKKPSALTDAEFEIMKGHPQKGYKIMSQIPGMKDYLPGMYMHHEMVNGKGYPQGLTDAQIPLQAKIVSVADTFDAMTIDRPYQKALPLPEALKLLKSFVGTRYDGKVVDALIEACNAGEVANGIVRQRAMIREAQERGGYPPSPTDETKLEAAI